MPLRSEPVGLAFVGRMAAAFREYRKTVFRRAIMPQPADDDLSIVKPRFRAGQAIWVQERFRVRSGQPVECAECPEDLAFACDFPYNDPAYALIDWRNALEMRRNLSRTTLIVQSVRLERLQDATDADCMREGIVEEWRALNEPPVYLIPGSDIHGSSPLATFKLQWDSVHGLGSWDANPWIYRVAVRVYHANVNVLLHGG